MLVLTAFGLENNWRYWFIHFIHFVLNHAPFWLNYSFKLTVGVHTRRVYPAYAPTCRGISAYFTILSVWNLSCVLFNPTLFPSERSLVLVLVHSTICGQVSGGGPVTPVTQKTSFRSWETLERERDWWDEFGLLGCPFFWSLLETWGVIFILLGFDIKIINCDWFASWKLQLHDAP